MVDQVSDWPCPGLGTVRTRYPDEASPMCNATDPFRDPRRDL